MPWLMDREGTFLRSNAGKGAHIGRLTSQLLLIRPLPGRNVVKQVPSCRCRGSTPCTRPTHGPLSGNSLQNRTLPILFWHPEEPENLREVTGLVCFKILKNGFVYGWLILRLRRGTVLQLKYTICPSERKVCFKF
jgi:hypothetical protein